MKRILCTGIALILVLTACSAPVQQVPPNTEPNANYTYGVYTQGIKIPRLLAQPGLFEIGGGISSPRKRQG